MKTLREMNSFKRDLKRVKKSGICGIDEIQQVVVLLLDDSPLPERFKDHPLKGQWVPARECHIRPDLLLVYEKTPEVLCLLRLGSHSELFK